MTYLNLPATIDLLNYIMQHLKMNSEQEFHFHELYKLTCDELMKIQAGFRPGEKGEK